MKIRYWIVIIIGLIICASINNNIVKQEKEDYAKKYANVYIQQVDSIKFINDSILNINRSLLNINNSLLITKDSINEELFVAKYKLERIRYYNDIAKNGNNIKFLRGWVYRVLDGDK